MFADGIGRAGGAAADGGDGADVDDCPFAGRWGRGGFATRCERWWGVGRWLGVVLEHDRNDGAGGVEGAVEVDGQDFFPLGTGAIAWCF